MKYAPMLTLHSPSPSCSTHLNYLQSDLKSKLTVSDIPQNLRLKELPLRSHATLHEQRAEGAARGLLLGGRHEVPSVLLVPMLLSPWSVSAKRSKRR